MRQLSTTMTLLVVTTKFDRPETALFKGIAQSGIPIDLICQPDAPGQNELIRNGIAVSTLTVRHRLDGKAIRFIRNRLKSGSYKIIYAPRNNCLSASLIASLGFDVKIVGYRGTSGHTSRWNPGDWLTYLNPRLDKIVCVSESVRRYLLDTGVPARRLITIHKGHEVSWYENLKTVEPIPWDIPSNAFIVGFVGNMRPDKGVETLIHSYPYLTSPDIHYVLIGEIRYPLLLDLSKDPNLNDHIHFLGFREDAVALMKVFSVIVMPSTRREGFPKAVVEAMAQGIPPIVTEVGGMPEIVRNGYNGLIVPPNNPGELARAIQHLANNADLREKLGRNARKTIIEEFNSKIMITRTVKMFNGLLEGKKRDAE